MRLDPFRTLLPKPLASREAITCRKYKFFNALIYSKGLILLYYILAKYRILKFYSRL